MVTTVDATKARVHGERTLMDWLCPFFAGSPYVRGRACATIPLLYSPARRGHVEEEKNRDTAHKAGIATLWASKISQYLRPDSYHPYKQR